MKIFGKILLTLLSIAVFFIGYILLIFYLVFDLTYQILFFTFLVLLTFITLLIIIWKKEKPKYIIFICLVSFVSIISFSLYYKFFSHKVEPLIYFHYKYNIPFKDIELIDSKPSEFSLFSGSTREASLKYNNYEISIESQNTWPFWSDDYEIVKMIEPLKEECIDNLNQQIKTLFNKYDLKYKFLTNDDFNYYHSIDNDIDYYFIYNLSSKIYYKDSKFVNNLLIDYENLIKYYTSCPLETNTKLYITKDEEAYNKIELQDYYSLNGIIKDKLNSDMNIYSNLQYRDKDTLELKTSDFLDKNYYRNTNYGYKDEPLVLYYSMENTYDYYDIKYSYSENEVYSLK